MVTLWDMKEYLAPRLTRLTKDIYGCHIIFIGRDEQEDEDDRKIIAQHRPRVASWAKNFTNEAEFLGLQSTMRQALKIAKSADKWNSEQIAQAVEQLETRFDEETEALKVFYVPLDRIEFYNKTDLFGEEFKNKFPLANGEIIEAGNCVAFDRFTACVFHLMRAMEIALRVLFVSLGLPPRIWSTTKWSQISNRIEGKIEKNNKVLAADPVWQKDRAFYENASAFVAAVRAPMRNGTMHVESVYDEPGAENVFGAVKSFMRHIATKLKE